MPPTVEILSPDANATLPANSTIQVRATASDNVGVTGVELYWAYIGANLPCAGTLMRGITCAQEGNVYTWSIPVGSGARTFHVTAIDAAGNRTRTSDRTIRLESMVGPTAGAPGVKILSPIDGQTFRARTEVAVRATVTGEDILSVTLAWRSSFGSQTFELRRGLDGTYSAVIRLGDSTGSRELTVTARDGTGQATTSEVVRIAITR